MENRLQKMDLLPAQQLCISHLNHISNSLPFVIIHFHSLSARHFLRANPHWVQCNCGVDLNVREGNNKLQMAEVIKKENIIDMPDNSDMIAEAMKEAKYAVDNLKVEYLMSKHIKEKFDEKYGTNWHCVVGKNFSSFVSYEAKNYIFFYEGQLAILLYKIG